MRKTIPIHRPFIATIVLLLGAMLLWATATASAAPVINNAAHTDLGRVSHTGDNLRAAGVDSAPVQWGFTAAQVTSHCVNGFADTGASLTGLSGGNAAWADYDLDGDLDFIVNGISDYFTGTRVTQLYRNDGGSFTPVNTGLPNIDGLGIAWGDYDNDNDPDILLSGYIPATNGFVSDVYRNNGDDTFTPLNAVPAANTSGSSAVAWGDYDKDGDLDFFLSGNRYGERPADVYRNDGNDTFTAIGAGINGASQGDAAWGDFDNDGDPDLLVAGYLTSGASTQLYRNDNGSFFPVNPSLPAAGSVEWGDYNQDGLLDIVLIGLSNNYTGGDVYRNNGDGTFTAISSPLAGLYSGDATFGDYDNDGDLDLAVIGTPGSGFAGDLFENTGNDTFVATNSTIIDVWAGSLDWGDYDDDGDPDLLLTGGSGQNTFHTKVYRNDNCDELAGYPLARPDSATGSEDIPLTIDVLANDSDPDGDPLTLVRVGNSPHGSAQIQNNKILFTPNPNFDGSTSIFYVINDGDPGHTSLASVRITMNGVNDAPTGLALSNNSVAENEPAGVYIGTFQAEDPENNGPFRYTLFDDAATLLAQENANFAIYGDKLHSAAVFDFETANQLTIRVRVMDGAGASSVREVSVLVTDGPDVPSQIVLSNNSVPENQPPGTTVGSLSALDSGGRMLNAATADGSASYTYALVPGYGGNHNDYFRIEGDVLKTNRELDYEANTVYSIRVSITTSGGSGRDGDGVTVDDPTVYETISIYPVNLPDPATIHLTNCSGNPISLADTSTLFREPQVGAPVVIRIQNVQVSNLSANGCSITGSMIIQAYGNNATVAGGTSTNLAFSGTINNKNQFSTSSIANFDLPVVGLIFAAKNVTIRYSFGEPGLRIGEARWHVPSEWGGASAPVSPTPVVMDNLGIKLSSGKIELPSFDTKSGIKLELSGRIDAVPGGYKIIADGSISIPNIGKKRATATTAAKDGQTCTIGAGVTIRVDTLGRIVMEIKTNGSTGAELMNSPQYVDAVNGIGVSPIALEAIRLSWKCDQGIPIGSTGVFLTGMSGEIVLEPGNESLSVEVTLAGGKDIPNIGPVLEADGSLAIQFRPAFAMDLGAKLRVLSFEVARANASITERSFSVSIHVSHFVYSGSLSAKLWSATDARTRKDRVYFTGSGDVSVGVSKGQFVNQCLNYPCGVKTCRKWGVRYPCGVKFCNGCVRIPPSTIRLAGVSVQVGEFTNGRFGFKGAVTIPIAGTYGFYVDEKGTLAFGNVNNYKLVSARMAAEARRLWRERSQVTSASIDPRSFGPYVFLDDASGKATGLIIDTPLITSEQARARSSAGSLQASDVISQVNLLAEADVSFSIEAYGPLTMSLLTPAGIAITSDNYTQANEAYDSIAYSKTIEYALEREIIEGEQDGAVARLFISLLSGESQANGVDLRIDGVVAFENLTRESAPGLAPLVLDPGTHLIEMVTTGTNNVVLSTNAVLAGGTDYSLLTLDQVNTSGAKLLLLTDDNSPPSAFNKARVRFYNGSTSSLGLVLEGSPPTELYGPIAGQTAGAYKEIEPGEYMVHFQANGQQASPSFQIQVDEGGVYTLFAARYPVGQYANAGLLRLDESYAVTHRTTYAVDQAVGDNWKVKVEGDTDNIEWILSVAGPTSPPVLSSLSVDAGTLSNAQVSWRLTSDYRPVTVTVFINPGAVTETLTITNTEGVASQVVVPSYTGYSVGQFVITDESELGGQLVTKNVDLSALASSAYYVWMRAEDANGSAVSGYAGSTARLRSLPADRYGYNSVVVSRDSYSPLQQANGATQLVIDRAADFPTTWTATISPTLDTETNTLQVSWIANDHPDVDEYRLLVGNTPLAPTRVITAGGTIVEYDILGNALGPAEGSAIAGIIVPGLPYYLSVEAVDSHSGRTVRSQEVLFQSSAGDFVLTSPQPEYSVRAGESLGITIGWQEVETIRPSKISLETDLTGMPWGANAGFNRSDEGTTLLEQPADTVTLSLVVEKSAQTGVYPLRVGGSNGHLHRTLTLQITVLEPKLTIYLPTLLK